MCFNHKGHRGHKDWRYRAEAGKLLRRPATRVHGYDAVALIEHQAPAPLPCGFATAQQIGNPPPAVWKDFGTTSHLNYHFPSFPMLRKQPSQSAGEAHWLAQTWAVDETQFQDTVTRRCQMRIAHSPRRFPKSAR